MIPTRKEWMQALEDRHGKKLQSLFSNAVIAVCGLGGLGSNIAISLARAGIGKLILIDFDKVEISNLNRQQYKANQLGLPKTLALSENIREIAPYTEVRAHDAFITEINATAFLSDADIICEAFDDPSCKAALANTVLTGMPDKYYIAASGMAGLGSPNEIVTRKITDRFYLCGDGKSDVNDEIGLVSSRAMLCASHQALTALRILAKQLDT